jgi:hypothetical protein
LHTDSQASQALGTNPIQCFQNFHSRGSLD